MNYILAHSVNSGGVCETEISLFQQKHECDYILDCFSAYNTTNTLY